MQEITVRDFSDRYLEEAKTFYKSFSPLSSVMKTFAVMYGDRQLQTLTPPDIHTYVHCRLKAGRKPSTINQELALLRSSINYAAVIAAWSSLDIVISSGVTRPDSCQL